MNPTPDNIYKTTVIISNTYNFFIIEYQSDDSFYDAEACIRANSNYINF
jgi:hypothetical protein